MGSQTPRIFADMSHVGTVMNTQYSVIFGKGRLENWKRLKLGYEPEHKTNYIPDIAEVRDPVYVSHL